MGNYIRMLQPELEVDYNQFLPEMAEQPPNIQDTQLETLLPTIEFLETSKGE